MGHKVKRNLVLYADSYLTCNEIQSTAEWQPQGQFGSV